MISKMKTNRKVMLLALLATGCGERFQLGEVAQELDPQTGSGAPTLPVLARALPVLADGVEDADAALEGGWVGPGLGDVDGDGFDDWMTSHQVTYGGPRPVDGIVRTAGDEGQSFRIHDGTDDILFTFDKAGDIDGDGYGDVVFSTVVDLYHRYEFENGEFAAEVAQTRATIARRWAEQRAFLWYGSPDREAGERELDAVAVAFPTREDLPRRFQQELTERPNPEEVGYTVSQNVGLTPLGDIDGDGYDDLAWTGKFSWSGHREEQQIDGVQQITTRERGEAVTYILYGRRDQLTSDSTPAARLPGGVTLRGIGDVNGDGYADVKATSGNVTRVLAGSAERLAGELAIDDISVPLIGADPNLQYQTARLGDIDQDGYDDLFLMWEADGESARFYLFYGSPSLLDAPLEKGAAAAMFAVHGPAFLPGTGDWNGDGFVDIVLGHARIVTDRYSAFAGSEVRLLPGGPERYSGEHEVSMFRPDATKGYDNVHGAVVPGDIDGDGFADLFFRSLDPESHRTHHVKYGSPNATPSAIY